MLHWMDGFDKYADNADLLIVYDDDGAPTIEAAGGITGGGAMNSNGSGNLRMLSPGVGFQILIDGTKTFHTAFWFKALAIPGTPVDIFTLGTNLHGITSSNACRIRCKDDGALEFIRHGATTPVFTSDPSLFIVGQWHHIELALRPHNTTGLEKVWIDRVLLVDNSGDTNDNASNPSSVDNIELGFGGTGGHFDDFLMWDVEGTDFAYTQLPTTHAIETLTPDSDVTAEFTRSAGDDNFALVDDDPDPDGDTTYVESSSVGDVDQYGLPSLAISPAAIYAVAVKARAKKTDINPVNLHTRVFEGATTTESGDNALTTDYLEYRQLLGKNPDTSAAWSEIEIAGMEIGIEHQA